MSDPPEGVADRRPALPAWAKESAVVELDEVVRFADVTPEWAWGGADGTGVRVAIVDSGIDADHPDLGASVDVDGGVALHLDPDGEVVERHGPHRDSFGHGTACAGIVHSLAPGARITSVKVLGEGLAGKAAVFLRGLEWCLEQGFDIVNLSLGTTRQDWALPFYELCDQAYFAGITVVTAANNVARPSWPSLIGTVTSVACNAATDPERFHYNPEPPTEFLARGVDVDVAWRHRSRIRGTGNSYAAPHITGMAARILSKHPGLRPFHLKAVLWATAANVVEAPTRVNRHVRRPQTPLRTSGVFIRGGPAGGIDIQEDGIDTAHTPSSR